ncbi:protein of unknown function [Microbacterium sp. Nx66]|nr:protein of unknown function [Microbacterium sp. Nx66]
MMYLRGKKRRGEIGPIPSGWPWAGAGGGVAHRFCHTDSVLHLDPIYRPQVREFESPFDSEARGFDPNWWSDPFLRSTARIDYRPYSFFDTDRTEAARVLVRGQAGFIDPEGAGVALPSDAMAIDFIEVRADLRHPPRGIGSAVVRQVERLFPDRTLFAFSENADRFWGSTGWTFVPRADGHTHGRALFFLERG